MKSSVFIWCFFFIVLSMVLPFGNAMADIIPVPADKKASLSTIEKNIDDEKKAAKAIEEKRQKAAATLKSTQSDLVRLATLIQEAEGALNRVDDRMDGYQKDITRSERHLEDRKAAMADAVMALQRLGRIPPEALMFSPGEPVEKAQAGLILRYALPELAAMASEIKIALASLKQAQDSLERERKTAARLVEKLESDRADLKKAQISQKKAYEILDQDLARRKDRITHLASQAQTLSELIKKLEDESRQASARTASQAHKMILQDTTKLQNEPIKQGSGRMPVAGKIILAFGHKDKLGAKSQGIEIESRPGSLVTAPLGGVVKFAGPFRRYGNMVIIEHADNYHSLIAGLGEVEAFLGQRLTGGAPIGTLRQDTSLPESRLYYEFRRKGKPIDPARFYNVAG